MADLNQMSDDDFLKLANKPGQGGAPALSDLSDEDFLKSVNPKQPTGFWDTAADVGKSAGAGVLRGAASLADLPGDITQLVSAGSKYATGYATPTIDLNAREAMSDLTGGFSERKPETTAGRYAGTVGEFVPGAVGAALTGGGSYGAQALNAAKGAILPGIASEALGQAVEGSSSPWMEPAARMAGAMLGGWASNKLENVARGVISPTGGAGADDLANAARLRELGVPVSAGQATKGQGIIGAEADTKLGQQMFGAAPDSVQAQAFTAASLRHLGTDAKLATPEAMETARRGITQGLENSVSGVTVQPTLSTIQNVSNAAKYFEDMAPKDAPGIFNSIIGRMSSGQPIPAEHLVAWRSNLGELLSSDNAGIRGTAFKLRETIDDAIENSLKAMGEPQRFEQWKAYRNQYRNYLAIKDALKVSQQTGVNGIITPKQLMDALARQSKDEIVTGRRGDIGELAGLGLKTIKPLPQHGKHGIIGAATMAAGPMATALGAGYGALQGAQWAGLSPLLTALGTGAAVATPFVSAGKQALRGFSMNPTVQRYLENQLVNSTSGVSNASSALQAGRAAIPSAMMDRAGRKTGGRVSNHEAAADQLVRAAERAKKGWSATTEPLLNQSDDAVAHALEVANRSI